MTLRTQGRTIGPTPVDTHSFVIPRWYPAQAVPVRAGHAVIAHARLPESCRFTPGATAAVATMDHRRAIDPTGVVREEEHDAFYDAALLPLCRVDHAIALYYDPTTGSATASRSDVAVVSRARAVTSGPTRTR